MGLIDFFFPQEIKCIFCGDETSEIAICENCRKTLPFIKDKICNKCGGRVLGGGNICVDCKSSHLQYKRCFCILNYEDDVKAKILKFKNGGYKNIGNTFAHLMYEKIKEIEIVFDIIIPIPIHNVRLKTRGFNQSEILCKEINLNYGKLKTNLLIRKDDTPHQTGLNRINRKENLIGAFSVSDKTKVKDKTILLVDDIYTTGSTISECAKTLLKAGAKDVYGLCLSRTPITLDKVVE